MRGYAYSCDTDNKVCCLLIYDICNDKRRRKIAKLCEGYGKRVQESAFEFCVTKRQYCELIDNIPKIVNEEDSVRIYPMRYTDKIISWGKEVDFVRCDVLIA